MCVCGVENRLFAVQACEGGEINRRLLQWQHG